MTSLKFQVQLPVYNVRAIMHGLHDLTGNDDKSLKGESLVCFNFRKINTIKQLTLYCDLLLHGSPSFFFLYFLWLFFVFCFLFFSGMRSIITKTDVDSMTQTSPLILSPTPPPRPQTHSLFHLYLINIIHSHICASKSNKTLALEVRLPLAAVNLFRESFMKSNH